MTYEQMLMAYALRSVGLFPGTFKRRFVTDMVHLADHQPHTELTPRQHKYLCDLVWRYRKRVPHAVLQTAVALAIHGPDRPSSGNREGDATHPPDAPLRECDLVAPPNPSLSLFPGAR